MKNLISIQPTSSNFEKIFEGFFQQLKTLPHGMGPNAKSVQFEITAIERK